MEDTNKKELSLDTKVTVRNIAGWSVGFARIADGIGDVTLPPDGSTRLSRNEIIAQVQSGNKLFAGTDGRGSHATIIIDDADTRIYLDFETAEGDQKQEVFTDAKLKALFELKSQANFEKKLPSVVLTRAEKYAAIQAIKRMGLNDYSKIRYIENYTGYRLQ